MVAPSNGDSVASHAPVIDKDPYSTEYLSDPYPFHEELREAVRGALARKVGRIELDGEPEWHLNNTVRGFEILPVSFHAA